VKGKSFTNDSFLGDTALRNDEKICLIGVMCIYEEYNASNKVITVHNSMTIHCLKELVQDLHGIDFDGHFLLFGGKPLAEDRTLGDCGIQNGSTVHVFGRLHGGVSFHDLKEELKDSNGSTINDRSTDEEIIQALRKRMDVAVQISQFPEDDEYINFFVFWKKLYSFSVLVTQEVTHPFHQK